MADKIETTAKMCQLAGYSREQFERIAQGGYIKSLGPNRWAVVETLQGIIKYLRDHRTRTSASSTQSRVSLARAREIELRVAEREHILIKAEEGDAFVDDIFGTLRSEMGGLPARLTRDLKLRSEIEQGVNDILNRVSRRLELQAQALAASGEVITRSTANDSGQVGSEE
jgi:hypothetical protein